VNIRTHLFSDRGQIAHRARHSKHRLLGKSSLSFYTFTGVTPSHFILFSMVPGIATDPDTPCILVCTQVVCVFLTRIASYHVLGFSRVKQQSPEHNRTLQHYPTSNYFLTALQSLSSILPHSHLAEPPPKNPPSTKPCPPVSSFVNRTLISVDHIWGGKKSFVPAYRLFHFQLTQSRPRIVLAW